MTRITPDRLRQLLRYEPESGKLFWRERPREDFATNRAFATWNSRYSGAEAFTNTIPGGYKTGTIMNKSYRAHIVIWAIVTGVWPDHEIDHRNGIRHDNRFSNFKPATSSENKRNCRRYSSNTSGVTGVYWEKRRRSWLVKISTGVRQVVEIGRFRTKEEAIIARKQAERRYGYSARHGSAA